MKTAPQPDEYRRLRALNELDLLDSIRDPGCDALVALATAHFNVSMAMIALMARDSQRIFAQHGMDLTNTPRRSALCNMVVETGITQIITDVRSDPRMRDDLLVTGKPFVGFYAGFPVRSPDGHVIATFCILDREPHALDEVGKRDFDRFGAIAQEMLCAHSHELAFKRNEDDLLAKTQKLTRANSAMEQVRRIAKIGTWEVDIGTMSAIWSEEVYRIHEIDVMQANSVVRTVNYYADYDRARVNAAVNAAIVDGTPFDFTADLVTAKGNLRHVRSAGERDTGGSDGVRLIGIFQDVTDAVEAQSRLKTAANETAARQIGG